MVRQAKRRSTAKEREERSKKILTLNMKGLINGEIAAELRTTKTIVSNDLKLLKQRGHKIKDNYYLRRVAKWIKIIKVVKFKLLPFYSSRGDKPSLRELHYDLDTYKDEHPGNIDYIRNHTHYNILGTKMALARRKSLRVTPKNEMFETLEMDCIIDETRDSEGETNIRPYECHGATDPIKEITEQIELIQNFIKNYQGSYDEYTEPGKWNRQEWHPEVWAEKNTVRPKLRRALADKEVLILDTGGNHSTPFIEAAAKRFKHILSLGQKVMILYFGDADNWGKHMDKKVKEDLYYYYGFDPERVVLKRVLVTDEQIRKYRLKGVEVEALTSSKHIRDFEKIARGAVDSCWSKEQYDRVNNEGYHNCDYSYDDGPDCIEGTRKKMAGMMSDSFKERWLKKKV